MTGDWGRLGFCNQSFGYAKPHNYGDSRTILPTGETTAAAHS
jgi:hypothetical protein